MRLFTEQHRRARRPRLLSDWAEDACACAGVVLLIVMIIIFAVAGAFPQGLAPLRDIHVTIAAGGAVR